jgi:putative acetyltransferase
MPIGPDFTRTPREDEHGEIHALLVAAFGRADEADIVRRLRADGEMWIELVKPWDGAIAGYAALSRMRAPQGWACLAPVAVLQRFRNGAMAPEEALRSRFSVGTRLVREIVDMVAGRAALGTASQDIPETVVVLGKPSFYERAGFSAARARRLVTPYDIDHTLIARPGGDVPSETLLYPAAFGN